MKAVQLEKFGAASEAFEIVEMESPTPKNNEVLVWVKYTSVNPLDTKLRSGAFEALVPNLPAILHGDMSGVVTAVGSEVTAFKVGDSVYGCIGGLNDVPGALAEYICVDSQLIAHKPETLNFAQSAAIPLVLETAWQGLFDRAGLDANKNVLVYGGTGGLGHMAALLAKACGADVTVTVATEAKASIVTEQLGIRKVANYKEESVQDIIQQYSDGKGFDIVFDTVGGNNMDCAIESVAINGHVVTILPLSNQDSSGLYLKNATLDSVFQPLPIIMNQNRDKYAALLKQAAEYIDAHHIKPLIDDESFTLEQVGQAHAHAESGKQIGKVLIKVSD